MTSLAQSAYEKIRERIATGELTAGSYLSETTLAHQMHISRTPVREAIRRLECEGVLEQQPKKGTFIHVPTRQEMMELFDLRILLEPTAAMRAARRQDPGLIVRLAELLGQMNDVVRQLETIGPDADIAPLSRRYRGCDQAFHGALLSESGNRRLCKIVDDIGILSLAMQVARIGPSYRLEQDRDANRDHEDILNAIRLGEPRRAFRAMRRHLLQGWRNAKEYLAWLAATNVSNR